MKSVIAKAVSVVTLAGTMAVLTLARQAQAADYVVDGAAPAAADGNAGTEDRPWKTIQHAADTVQPGDSVYVMAGRYDERVKVKTSGGEGHPITFQAMPRRSVIVNGFDLQGSYIRMSGFEITADKPAIAVQLEATHCEVLDNYIHDMMNGVAGAGSRRTKSNRIAYNHVYHCEYGFLLMGDDWLVENNEVERQFMYSTPGKNTDADYSRFFGIGCVCKYNYYHGTISPAESKNAHVDVIQTFYAVAQDLLFEDNTCFDWGQGAMIESGPNGSVRNWTWRHNIYSSNRANYKGAWGLDIIKTPGVTIENNTFAGISWGGVGLRGQESTGGQIRNNIFADVDRAVIDGDKDFTASKPLMEYNLTFLKNKDFPLAGQTNINNKDPMFVDAAQRDFRLRKGSAAIGAGKGGVTIGALDYPNVWYVDPHHPAATDDPAWGYPGVPLASLAKACAVAAPGETIVLRGGIYRETLQPPAGVVVRAMKGEKVTISGADAIAGWKHQADGSWTAPLPAAPQKVLRDGQPWAGFTYDKAAKQITIEGAGDPRLHLFETVVRPHGIVIDGKDAQIEGVTVVNTLGAMK